MTNGQTMHPSGGGNGASSFDWSTSTLGPAQHWPLSLRLTVDILLNAPLPMTLMWGREHVFVCNEAYAALAGGRHASAPGGSVPPTCPSAWSANPAALEAALQGQPSTHARQQLSFPREGGGSEGMELDVYYTPIRAEGGEVGGVLMSLAPSMMQAAAPVPAGRALRILVVEDNLDAQFLVCEMLSAFGHSTDAVADGEHALERCAHAAFDVLFSDVSLPGISGVELARQALQIQPNLKVVFASGYGDTLLRHVEFPFVSLQKPYDLDQ